MGFFSSEFEDTFKKVFSEERKPAGKVYDADEMHAWLRKMTDRVTEIRKIARSIGDDA